MTKLKNTTQKFFRNFYKTIRLNSYYNIDLNEMDLEEELNNIILNFILLSNEGEYRRFNSYDFYSKSSKIKSICNSISKVQAYRDQFPNKLKRIKELCNLVSKHFSFMEKPLDIILNIIEFKVIRDKELFFEVRNLIVSEWIERNKNNPNSLIHKTKLKDLNYLNYSLEEYQNYLNNCYNYLIRDTKKFINKYPEEFKINQNLDLELLLSLRDSIYNDINFLTPEDFRLTYQSNKNNDLNIFKLINNPENADNKIILRGWFKDKPDNCKIDTIAYKAYKKFSV